MNNMNVAIVGPIKENAKKGKTNPKIFLYQDMLNKMGYQTKLFTTSLASYRVFTLTRNLIRSLKFGDTVLLMFGGNASNKLLKPVLFLNKIYKKRLILCPFGIGPLIKYLKNKDNEFVGSFIRNSDFHGFKDNKMSSLLSRLDLVVLQNDVLKRCFDSFYNLKNTYVLPNIRMNNGINSSKEYRPRSLVFISRVNKEKGVLDLMEVISKINDQVNEDKTLCLDIYGEKHLSSEEEMAFDQMLNEHIKYHGTVSNDKVIEIISSHSFSCLPTKHIGEGTPGFIVESLIAGVPVISSDYPQVESIIKNGYNGFVFEVGNKDELKNVILAHIYNEGKIVELKRNAFESGKRYVFENNLEVIRKMIEG